MPMAKLKHLFEPIEVGGVRIKNRIVNTANVSGLAHIEARAKGGAGLFVLAGPDHGIAHYTGSPFHFVPGATGEAPGLPNPATSDGREFFDATITPI